MKIRSFFIFLIASSFFTNATAQDSTLREERAWYLPDYAKVQFAGNIGFLSVGIGYKFFNDHLYSELLYGYVPPTISKAEKIHVVSIKNTFPVFTKRFDSFTLSPIAGFTASFETGNNSYLKYPDKYPDDYYVANAFHFTLFIGASAHKKITNSKIINGVDLYFELSTVEAYLWYAITSKEIGLNDIFSSAIGVNFHF